MNAKDFVSNWIKCLFCKAGKRDYALFPQPCTYPALINLFVLIISVQFTKGEVAATFST